MTNEDTRQKAHEERVQCVAKAIWSVEQNPYKDFDEFREYAEAAIAASDATLEVTPAMRKAAQDAVVDHLTVGCEDGEGMYFCGDPIGRILVDNLVTVVLDAALAAMRGEA